MTMLGAVFIFFYAFCAITMLSVLARILLRDKQQDRTNGVEGVDSLEVLKWGGWTLSDGWPPMTCWPGCRDFHYEGWWTHYQERTCWPGCADLHRDDWWRPYLDQVDSPEQDSDVLPLSAGKPRPGRRRWVARPALLSRTAGLDRAASEGIPRYGGTVALPSGRTSPQPPARVAS